ncbi:methyl-accepting chemotaxis protein [Halalkalibacter wakoensis JCM 9140]|uniref:Methyl-accepting chemotaxis protein n=1 Tax=Halalkalibacter wakoensis JCM 9140 TaxID=1236970 RepID=W4Q7J5_9BACI|nr:MCP four helix bundle domain-containing protein [Halalkalibacter wakoensis]GAE27354.1 methyl-accepting chemotaxis protein [Halalkalibacter wakoensis JCM 9140]
MKVSIRKKLIGSFLIVSLIFGGASFLSYLQLVETNKSYTYLVETVAEIRSVAQEVEVLVALQTGDLRGYMIYEIEMFKRHLQENNENINTLISKGKELSTLEENIERLDELATLNESFLIEATKVMEAISVDKEEAIREANHYAIPLTTEMRERANDMSNWLGELLHQRQDETNRMADRTVTLMISLSSIALIFAIGCGILVSNIISRPINQLANVAKQVAGGNLATEPFGLRARMKFMS